MKGFTRRERVRLSFIPEWTGKIEQWTKKFIREHHWRCDSIHTPEDLLQDAYLIFHKIYERYPRVTDPPHFMSLYKKALQNRFHDHSRYTRRKRLVHMETADDGDSILIDYNSGPLNSILGGLPEEVQQALILLTTKPDLTRYKVGGVRENLNAMLWRTLGLGKQITAGGRIRPRLKIDFTGMLRQVLA